ncbi:MAG TPA: selenocysteine-specific translation elongation factor [Candidatus Acidoferrales bacterium]|nr:selenocysteine-specific translation elongation factor [Candidatus Acidoferrales bacterium]
MKNIIVGTAGHIDHGKSALVEALTGTHPDRLEEEKRRGITIDLGFAFLEMDEVRLGFVDVPGHERFVRNMLAGVGGIDLVLLVVAADESIKPQTREHFDICRLLGTPHGLIALTKADLVDSETLELARLEVEEFVRGSFLERAPILPVSARTGLGLAPLKQALVSAARRVPERDPSQYFRLPVDRAFLMKGFGTVVTGTLVSGRVSVGDELELLPGGRRVRVRGIHSAGHVVESAVAGQRTALNLAGVDLDQVGRGTVAVAPGRFRATRQIDARITLLRTSRPLNNRALVHFHQGTAEAVAEVVLLEGPSLQPGDSALAQLRIRQPVLLLPGDRFILRQFSPITTFGGGIVLDCLASRHRRRDTGFLPLLRTLESAGREESLAVLAEAKPRGLTLKEAVARTAWLEADLRGAAEALERCGRVRAVGKEPLVIASAAAVAGCAESIRSALEKFHQSNPLVAGIPKEDLRDRAARGLRQEIFHAALADMARTGQVVLEGDLVMRGGRKIVLTAEEEQARRQIERAFQQAGLAVPRLADLLPRLPVDTKRAGKLLQLLLRERVLVRITEDLVYHASAVARLRPLLADYKLAHGERISVPAFKELTGVTRKYAIPLLEYLDRERVTRRVGDERVIL